MSLSLNTRVILLVRQTCFFTLHLDLQEIHKIVLHEIQDIHKKAARIIAAVYSVGINF